MLKIVSIVGARPQFIKADAISRAINELNKKRVKVKEVLLHTGQHYDYNMSDIFFGELGLKKPKYNLNVGSYSLGQRPASQNKQIALMLEGIEKVLIKEKPNLVVVYGDTNSTLAGALAAKKLNIKLAHVEAGLRSYRMDMPEEVNRVVADRLSDIHLCPSKNAVKNLAKEGIRGKVLSVGDVMYDTVLFYLNLAKQKSEILSELSLKPKRYYIVTVHRAINTDNRLFLKSILEALSGIARNGNTVIFPLHPRTKKAIKTFGLNKLAKSLRVIAPVSYMDMLILEKNAKVVLTDSGGVQKEAYFLKVPCITLREETEWVETVKTGLNILTGACEDKQKITKAIKKLEKTRKNFPRLYGDGTASSKIVNFLLSNSSGVLS